MTGDGVPTLAEARRSNLDIARRPAIDPEMLAAVAAAVDQAWPRPRIVVADDQPTVPRWRFSGRWWSRPATVRRDRPFT